MLKILLVYLFVLVRLFYPGWNQTVVEYNSPEVTSTPAPLSQSQAEQRLIVFMEAWKNDRLEEMMSLVQPSWASAQEYPYSELFSIKGNRTPLEYTIESISGTDADDSRVVQMSALIHHNDGRVLTRCRFMIVMNKEDGEWYVDPNSLATFDLIEYLNADGTPVSTPTQMPCTTVTPVPLPDTKLYYNPNGGSFYHADPECVTVHSDFLPLQGSFLYRDLKEYQEILQPCFKCGAPVYPASE